MAKKLKEVVKDKYWEVLKFYHYEKTNHILKLQEGSQYYYWESDSPNKNAWTLQQILDSNCFIILSVRRLVDKEVFSIGDKLKTYDGSSPYVISSFVIDPEVKKYGLRVGFGEGDWLPICEIEKLS